MCAIILVVVLIELLIDADHYIIEFLHRKQNTIWSELAVNGLIGSVLLSGYTLKKIVQYKKLVNKQVLVENELQSSQQKLEMLLMNSATVVYTAPPDGQSGTSYISGNVSAILGYEPAEFDAPHFWSAVIHPDDVKIIFASHHLLFETGHLENEFRVRHKDGSWRWIYNKMILVRNENGTPNHMVGSWLDITDRKIVQDEIRKSEERFERAAKATRGIIYEWCGEAKTFWTSEHALTDAEYLLQHLSGVTIFEGRSKNIHPDDIEGVRASLMRAIDRKEENWSQEYRMKKANGSYGYVMDRSLLTYTEEGKIKHCIGMLTDLTRLKEIEQELRLAKEKAEVSAQAKSEFLANMSHEIRTPLNGIIGMAELGLETKDISPELHRYLTIIRSSSDTLLALINDILDFSKIDAGKMELSPTVFSMRDEIPKSLQVLALKAAEKNLELIYHLDQAVPDPLIGDVMRLQQVMVNLVGNAIKFTETGEVLVNVRLQSLIDDELVLEFTITDTGIGIPAEKQATIFEAFLQSDNTITRKYGGTGLGLTISKRLIEKMGGRITLTSEQGKGSTFKFTVKLQRAMDAHLHRFRMEAELHTHSVLVVENNASARENILAMLRQFGVNTKAVSTAEEGLAELQKAAHANNPYSIVITEINLHGKLNGFEFVSSIKNDPRLAAVNIVVTTMSQRACDRERCTAIGVSAFFCKPFSPSDLLDCLNDIIAGRRQRSHHREDSETTITASRNVRILLVEDNKVNQEVVLSILHRHGYTAKVAQNGREALQQFAEARFDVILMDVQMPLMNGYETTQKIRELEKNCGAPVTIIGLTANAMEGDRQKCLDAGMDDYLSKPLQVKSLLSCLSKYSATDMSDPRARRIAVNVDQLFQKLGSDCETVTACLAIFCEEWPLLLQQTEQSCHENDAQELMKACHQLRGALITLEMHAAYHVATKLEEQAKAKNFAKCQVLIERLKLEVSTAIAAIEKIARV